MGPLNLTLLVIGLAALTWELSGLRPRRLLPDEAPPPPDLGPGRAEWQAYVLLPAPLAAGASTAPVDRAAAAILASHPSVQLVIVDRGAPGPVVARSDRVAVVHVTGPDDVDNTAAFLNAGIDVIHHDVQRRALDPARVVVMILDLESRLPSNALELVVEAFQDPALGGVQLAALPSRRAVLELSNSATTAWAAGALPRSRPGWFGAPAHAPVGQAYRLSALTKVDERPWWTTVPAAEVDLAASLHVDGWTLATTDDVVVAIPVETRLRDVARTRTRSLHAGLHASSRLGELWHSKDIDNRTLVRVTARTVSHWLLTLASLFLLVGAAQLLLAVPRGDLGHLGLAPVVLLAYLASRAVVFVVALVVAIRMRLRVGREPAAALGLTVASVLSVLGNLRSLGRIVFRLGGYVGVDEFQVSGVGLAVARPARVLPTRADLPIGPVRLKARIHEAPRRSRRRR